MRRQGCFLFHELCHRCKRVSRRLMPGGSGYGRAYTSAGVSRSQAEADKYPAKSTLSCTCYYAVCNHLVECRPPAPFFRCRRNDKVCQYWSELRPCYRIVAVSIFTERLLRCHLPGLCNDVVAGSQTL